MALPWATEHHPQKAGQYKRIWHENGTRMTDPMGYLNFAKKVRAGELKTRFTMTPEDQKHLLAHYDSGVPSADTYLGFFFEQLGTLGLWDNTIIIRLSDHGEDLQQHDFTNHRAGLWDKTTHVPWIIRAPGLKPRSIDRPASTMDMGATVLGLLGVDTAFPGHNWLHEVEVPPHTVESEGLSGQRRSQNSTGPKE